MKILILAAGRGTRIQSSDTYQPKPLVRFHDSPLFLWSYKSFHALLTEGILSQSDFIFVLDSIDSNTFRISEEIRRQIGPAIQIVELTERTSGPSETAYVALKQLNKKKLIEENETIIISDCDHFFNAAGLFADGKPYLDKNEVRVVLADKDSIDLSWSFPIYKNERIVGIIEKPQPWDLQEIILDKGCVGCYVFQSVSQFLELYGRVDKSKGEVSYFVSEVINVHLRNSINFVSAYLVDLFVPLGNHEQLKNATEKIPSKNFIFDKPTLLIDFDGVVVEHDQGFHSRYAKWNNPKVLNAEIFVHLKDLQSFGWKIIITTSRPEICKIDLKNFFSNFDFQPNQIICGLTGGRRILVNDLKPSIPYLSTAIAVNIQRNQYNFPIEEVKAMNEQSFYLSDLSSESGEKTSLLQDSGGRFVRKNANISLRSQNLLRYQFKWLNFASEIIPAFSPKILGFFDDGNLVYLDTAYMENLVPFISKLRISEGDGKEKLLTELSQGLSTLYENTASVDQNIVPILFNIFRSKSIPGYLRALSHFKTGNQESHLNINFCGKLRIRNRLSELLEVQLKLEHGVNIFGENVYYPSSLIHGDPTLSNISYANGHTVFLDPIGSLINPTYDLKSLTLGRAPIEFDMSRIRLSLIDKYELWESTLKWEEIRGEFYLDLDQSEGDNYEESWRFFYTKISEKHRGTNRKINLLLHISTLLRVLPYKLPKKEKEAAYIPYLVDLYVTKLLDNAWDDFQ